MKNFITKTALNFGLGHDKVREELRKQINTLFLDIGVKLLKAHAAFHKEPDLKALLTTCNKVQYQADALQKFLLEKEQFEALTQMLITYGKKYGSFDDLKPKISTSPAVQEMKVLLQNLLSVEIYNSLTPLAEQMGSFDKLQMKEQQSIVDVLKSEKAITQVKSLNLSTTFGEIKKNMVALTTEFELSSVHRDQLTTMVDKIEKAHLAKLADIKTEVEQYLPPLQQKLLETIYVAHPDLKIAQEKPKEIVPSLENKKKRTKEESKEEATKKEEAVNKPKRQAIAKK